MVLADTHRLDQHSTPPSRPNAAGVQPRRLYRVRLSARPNAENIRRAHSFRVWRVLDNLPRDADDWIGVLQASARLLLGMPVRSNAFTIPRQRLRFARLEGGRAGRAFSSYASGR